MAHQTFYIDIDEEITSIVERLRHARASEIILVVPKHALLIQSIVNLRILKKEADELRLQLMIVTQDKLGKILIEKAGIFVQQKMDNIADEEIEMEEENSMAEEFAMEDESLRNGKNRLDNIGSSSFFDELHNEKKEEKKLSRGDAEQKGKLFGSQPEEERKETLINKELVFGVEKNIQTNLPAPKPSLDMQPVRNVEKLPAVPKEQKLVVNYAPNPRSLPMQEAAAPNFQDKKIENFFSQASPTYSRPEKPAYPYNEMRRKEKDYALSGGVHKWFWAFGVIAVLAASGVAAYLFIPKAEVDVFAKFDSTTIDSQIVAKVDTSSGGMISAKSISASQKADVSYESTGNESVSNQKSHGKVTIYNEYSSSEQPLVATTRFLTPDGKLFRLVKGVTVPGMTTENGEKKPGTVEAEIAADESGDGFNISPTTFSIPGFKSSGSKYEKIYAKSTVAMTGGGNGTNEAKMITEGDIAAAKAKALVELNGKLEEQIKSSYGNGATILDGALSEGDVTYSITNSAGDVADSFQVSASAEAKALVIKESELEAAISDMLKNAANGKNIEKDSIKIDFSRSDVDFDTGLLTIKFHATGNITPEFSAETIKENILGKDESQLKDYLGGFPNIQRVEVEYWPTFFGGRIPFISSRVNVAVDSI